MKNLNISVVGKVAKYLQRDGAIVCGNSDYQITFTFDAEWDAYSTKTARFVWNGKYLDQVFSGSICPVPIINDTTEVTVGVYAGELSTTTPASIPCKRSILCGTSTIQDEKVKEYRDEAIVAAERAEAAADRAEASGGSSSGGTTSNAPSYVVSEAEAIADKVLAVRNANSFVMALASDFHTKGEEANFSNGAPSSYESVKHAGQGMNEINKLAQLDLVALLGDYEFRDLDDEADDEEDASKSFKHVRKSFYDVSNAVPTMWLQGNHDYTTGDTQAQKYYAFIGANNVGMVTDYANKFRNYGYRDFDNYKIRVIYLNTTDVASLSYTASVFVSAEQQNWLNNVALNFADKADKTEWGVIVLTHCPLNSTGDGIANVLTILNTFKGKTDTAKFIAHFNGNNHNFAVRTFGTNNVVSITIPNVCFGRNNEYGTYSGYDEATKENFGDVDADGNQRQFNKTSGTANDTSFNVVVVDRENREIHCFNYGAGIHRTVTFDGVVTETEKDNTTGGGNDNTGGGNGNTGGGNGNTGTDTPDNPVGGYTNVIDTVGYTQDARISTSTGKVTTDGASGYVTTGLIDATGSEYSYPVTFRTEGVDFTYSKYPNAAFAMYNADGTHLGTISTTPRSSGGTTVSVDAEGNLTLTIDNRASGKVRLCGYGLGENLIVTINEEIN